MTHHRAAFLVALALLITGCSANAATRGEGDKAYDAPKPTAEVVGLVLPFDAYELSHGESFTIAKAQDLLIRACMHKRGHEWQVLNYPEHVDDLKNRRRYGVIEIQVARKFGYHATSDILSGATDITDQRRKRDEHLGTDGVRAAYDEKTGCGYKANAYLLRDGAKVDYSRFNRLSSELLAKAKREPTAIRTLKRWEACMRNKGFDYRTPDESIADPRWWSEESGHEMSDGASRQEIATAVADVQCKQRTRLVKVLYTEESRLQRRAVALHRSYFGQLASAKTKNLKHAREVINRQ
ncbi:hypothetical protein [Streptomyces sp. TRM70350]|uniref:hypothetical protein n=1 Tax=Streptomyces sp. TRM70350 TaxID=2856165 RepID=UPI001C43F1FF|nr:hypothetical protein [Streptomyces sp. TRM70350]MBV7698448.1 hypothetical protein [Streptomyces sp. TRM70350]